MHQNMQTTHRSITEKLHTATLKLNIWYKIVLKCGFITSLHEGILSVTEHSPPGV